MDLNRRINEHNTNNSVGSKYTRTRRPVKIVYVEQSETRSLAGKREREIKKLSRLHKLELIESGRAPR